jgi:4-amino-4-deoxy-L-arabinose transferase-like glycosyltransferase
MRPSFSPTLLQTVVISLLLAFAFLGTRAIWDPDEGRYTNVALNMLESGDWIHPMRNEHVGHWTKPPLTYWVVAASVASFGYNPWAARIPYALAFLFCAWMVWRIARRLIPGEENRAALIYATMLLPFGAAQMITTDFLLSAALSGAMAAWIESRHGEPEHSRRWVMLMWLGFGLAFLTKGPPALLPLLAVTACAFLLPRRGAALVMHWSGMLIFAVVGFSWFVIVISDTPGLLDYFLGRELIDRVASDDFQRHGEWYGWIEIYLPTLLVGTLPWTWPLWRWLRSLPAAVGRWRKPESRLEDSTGLMLFLWVLLPMIVFCLSRSRLPLYLLPLFTPLALIIARQMRIEARTFPRLIWLGIWVVMLIGLRYGSVFWDTHKNAEDWADAIRARVTHKVNEVGFVNDMARYGVHLHLGARVDKVSIDPRTDTSLDPTYDSDLDTELADGDDAGTVYITKQKHWPRVRKAIESKGRSVVVFGEPYEERVIFGVVPETGRSPD